MGFIYLFGTLHGEPIRLITGSTRMNRVLSGLGSFLTRTEICNFFSTQPDPNPWWARLARGL